MKVYLIQRKIFQHSESTLCWVLSEMKSNIGISQCQSSETVNPAILWTRIRKNDVKWRKMTQNDAQKRKRGSVFKNWREALLQSLEIWTHDTSGEFACSHKNWMIFRRSFDLRTLKSGGKLFNLVTFQKHFLSEESFFRTFSIVFLFHIISKNHNCRLFGRCIVIPPTCTNLTSPFFLI